MATNNSTLLDVTDSLFDIRAIAIGGKALLEDHETERELDASRIFSIIAECLDNLTKQVDAIATELNAASSKGGAA